MNPLLPAVANLAGLFLAFLGVVGLVVLAFSYDTRIGLGALCATAILLGRQLGRVDFPGEAA